MKFANIFFFFFSPSPYWQFDHAAYAKPFLPLAHRVKLRDGVTFLGARPCNPMLWMISQDARVEGHRVVTLHCQKKESSYAQRSVACHGNLIRRLIWELNYSRVMKCHVEDIWFNLYVQVD